MGHGPGIKEMNGSRSVNTYITPNWNARLAMPTGEKLSGSALSLQQKASAYLHQSALDEHKEILKAQKDGVKFYGVVWAVFCNICISSLFRESRYLQPIKWLIPIIFLR